MTPPTARKQLRCYADVIAMWVARFDTQEIAIHVGLPEHTVARWVANFRDVTRMEPEAS
jgi:hypothetical protein